MARRGARLVGRSLLWVVAVLALLMTCLLTAPRLIEPTDRRGIELVSLTPLGLVPAAVLVLVGLGLVRIHRGGLRLTVAVLTLAGVVSTALHLAWLAPLFVGTQPAPAANAGSLVLMTQNFEYGDATALAAEVRARHVDVLVLCDLADQQWVSVAGSTIPRDLPHRSDNGGGVVVFSRYPVTDDRSLQLHGDGRSVHLESGPVGPLTLFALHGVQPRRPADWQEDWVRITDALATSLGREASRAVVAGDLNATLDHLPMRRLESLGLTDAVDAVNGGYQPTYPAPGSDRRLGIPMPPLFQIDHVLVGRGLVVTSAATVRTPGADHLGVVVTISGAAG
ncbi:MAG: endonuclease/exonuclease/phosphatase family protein [Intrasporangium sp.]|uniref:endonuclease/exonuclease/phosphatase family protein n=1 Tax=Intrasporangium sp. TaxID=1925024 RepID=UPI003F7F6106